VYDYSTFSTQLFGMSDKKRMVCNTKFSFAETTGCCIIPWGGLISPMGWYYLILYGIISRKTRIFRF